MANVMRIHRDDHAMIRDNTAEGYSLEIRLNNTSQVSIYDNKVSSPSLPNSFLNGGLHKLFAVIAKAVVKIG